MATKLVRKQLLLDQSDLLYIEQIIKNQPKYTSLSHFVRDALRQKIQQKPLPRKNKKAKILALAGSVDPTNHSDPSAAVNHNDIYTL